MHCAVYWAGTTPGSLALQGDPTLTRSVPSVQGLVREKIPVQKVVRYHLASSLYRSRSVRYSYLSGGDRLNNAMGQCVENQTPYKRVYLVE